MKKNIKNILKFLAITLIFLVLFFVFIDTWKSEIKASSSENKTNFSKIENSNIAKTWVAISANIWLDFYKNTNKTLTNTIYKEVFSVKNLKEDEKKLNNLITQNMLSIKEYVSILKTDIKWNIKNSKNKEEFLESFINQLKIRYKNWVSSIKILNEQKAIFKTDFDNSSNKINEAKSNIKNNFKNVNTDKINWNISNYLDYRNDYYFSRTYIIFINQFIENYSVLNNYNKNILTFLSNNKEALINWNYVVMPDSGILLLKDYWLLYTEDWYKTKEKKEKTE